MGVAVLMKVHAVRYVAYYRAILKRIAEGAVDSPAGLAKTALDWQLHHPSCASRRDDFGECDCGARVLAPRPGDSAAQQ
jgi:hypothetical protein